MNKKLIKRIAVASLACFLAMPTITTMPTQASSFVKTENTKQTTVPDAPCLYILRSGIQENKGGIITFKDSNKNYWKAYADQVEEYLTSYVDPWKAQGGKIKDNPNIKISSYAISNLNGQRLITGYTLKENGQSVSLDPSQYIVLSDPNTFEPLVLEKYVRGEKMTTEKSNYYLELDNNRKTQDAKIEAAKPDMEYSRKYGKLLNELTNYYNRDAEAVKNATVFKEYYAYVKTLWPSMEEVYKDSRCKNLDEKVWKDWGFKPDNSKSIRENNEAFVKYMKDTVGWNNIYQIVFEVLEKTTSGSLDEMLKKMIDEGHNGFNLMYKINWNKTEESKRWQVASTPNGWCFVDDYLKILDKEYEWLDKNMERYVASIQHEELKDRIDLMEAYQYSFNHCAANDSTDHTDATSRTEIHTKELEKKLSDRMQGYIAQQKEIPDLDKGAEIQKRIDDLNKEYGKE